MSERLQVIAFALALLGLFTAMGSGPVVLLARQLPAWPVLAPVVGFALTASVAPTVALVVPLGVGVWVVLVPLALLSVVVAAVGIRRTPLPRARDVVLPVGVATIGLALALAPAVARGATGPYSVAVYDAWGYVSTTEWLRTHTTRDPLPAGDERFDRTLAMGHAYVSGDATRIGVDAVNAVASALLGVEGPSTLYALLAALFALGPLGIWVAAAALGVRRGAAAFGAAYGLSPAIFTLVGDTTLANLAGVVLAPVALLLVARSLVDGGARDVCLAAVVSAGLVAVYPEFLPVAAPSALVATVVLFLVRRRERRPGSTLRPVLTRAAALAAGTAIIAPYATAIAIGYLARVGGGDAEWSTSLPQRGFQPENIGAWVFGILHLYQLPVFDLLSGEKVAFAVTFPMVLAAVVVVGVARSTALGAALVAAPTVIAVAAGTAAYHRYQSGTCEYCLWKSLTFLLPFLAIGLALGIDVAWGRLRRTSGRRRVDGRRLGVVAVAALALASVGRSDARFAQAIYKATFVTSSERTLDASIGVLGRAHVLVEGTDAMPVSAFALPSAYYESREPPLARVSFDAQYPAPAYLGVLDPPPFYSPAYTHVVTPFGGMRSDRALVGRHSPYSVYRRSPVDVVVSRAVTAIDPDESPLAIPWIQGPFELRISSARASRVAVTIELDRPADSRSSLRFFAGSDAAARPDGASVVDRELPRGVSPDGSRLCFEAGVTGGTAVVRVEPVFEVPPVPTGRASVLDPYPVPSKVLGLKGVAGQAGSCALPVAFDPPLVFDRGWYDPEIDAAGVTHRWMQTDAALLVGRPRAKRPRVRLSAGVSSFAVARTLEIRVAGRRIVHRIAADSPPRPLVLDVPAGDGVALVELRVRPPAQPAALAEPTDPRSVSLRFSDVEAQRR